MQAVDEIGEERLLTRAIGILRKDRDIGGDAVNMEDPLGIGVALVPFLKVGRRSAARRACR